MGKPVVVEQYNEEWAADFQAIKAELNVALGNLALRIEHIGSTSVIGLSAKPIIDPLATIWVPIMMSYCPAPKSPNFLS